METEKENDAEENNEDAEKDIDVEDASNVENISNPEYESEDISEVTEWQEENNTTNPDVNQHTEPVAPVTKNSTGSNKTTTKKDEKLNDNKHSKSDEVKHNENSLKQKPKNNQKEENVNGKKKIREGKPFTKVVIRRLPPTMTKEVFLDQVSPLPTFDYFYFVPSNMSSPGSFSRAYINFLNQNDLFDFTRTFDNYVFIDSKGHEFPAIVEFAPYQRVPKSRPGKKKDLLMGTLESDPIYVTFKEQLQAEALENSRTTNKQHYFETEINESEEVVTTPLLEFLKAQRAEKDRIREERREDRKRKEVERKLLKQKIKDKPAQDEEVEIKVLQPPKDKKDFAKEKDSKRAKHKDKEDRFVKPENRTREFKNKGGKSYREERLKQAEKREEKKKKEIEEGKERDETIIEEEIKEEEKYWTDKKKWKYGGGGEGKGGRTFSRRRDEKKKDVFDRKRNSGKPYRARKGSGELLDDNQKKDKTEVNSPEVTDKSTALPLDKAGTKESLKSPKKDKENFSSNHQEANSKKDNLSNSAQKFPKDKAESFSKEKETSQQAKENKKGEKENVTSEVNKKDRLQKESSVDSEEGCKNSKDPRAERRIRNKDRPSIEIYRPGMGKFSRQRLEKERTLGSTDESPSHSPSPTPNNNKSNLN